MGLVGGSRLDLTTCDENGDPWDFSQVRMRNKACHLVMSEKPLVLVASVMCTRWSQIMRLLQNKIDQEKYARLMDEARVHLGFVCKLCKLQARNGRFYLQNTEGNASV